MRSRNHQVIAGRLALCLCAATVLRAQQAPQSDSGRRTDTSSTHRAAVISGLATTIPSKNAPNAVPVVTVSDSTRPPAAALETLIDGRVPGATIESSTSDAPGAGLEVLLRGSTSINSTDAPLYVVDGVIVMSQISGGAANVATAEGNGINRIVDINPSDIASVQVLKGPSATAIYGAEGGAGVVIITTKQGTGGATHWDVSGAVGHYSLAHEVPLRQFPTLASAQAWYVNDVTHDTTAAKISADNAFIQGVYAGPQDYQRQLFGNSQASYITSISANGTVAATQYYFSALSRYDNGVMLNTGDDRQSLRGNVTQHVGGTLSLAASLDYIGDVTRQGSATDGLPGGPYQAMTYTPQFVDLDHEGSGAKWTINPFGTSNPFADERESSAPAETHRLIAGGDIAWMIVHATHQSLQLQVAGGVDRTGLRDVLVLPTDLQSQQSEALPGLDITNTGHLTYTNYSGSFIHHIATSWLDATTSAGYASDRQDNRNPVTVGENLLTGINTPTPTPTVVTNFFYTTTSFQHSYYAQEQIITAASRLAITGGVTGQSSTLNGNTGEFFPYPHYAASYRVRGPGSVIDEIKLRAAYGVSGNLAPYGSRFVLLNIPCISGSCPSASPAPGLKPEAVRETELGFDMPMFAGRAQISATLYDKHVSDLLLDATAGPGSGYASVIINGGSFKDQGAELELQATPLQMRNGFAWTTTATFTRNYSAVGSMPIAPFEASPVLGNYILPGRSVSEIVNTNFLTSNGLPVQVGDFMPGYQMSFGDAISFRSVRLFALGDWSRGGTARDILSSELDFGSLAADSALAARNVAADIAGRDPWLESASYFTLRQVVLSYSLPAGILRRVPLGRFASVRLTLTGYDLWSTFSYRGPAPQAAEFGNQQSGTASTVFPYPPARSYFLGLDLGL